MTLPLRRNRRTTASNTRPPRCDADDSFALLRPLPVLTFFAAAVVVSSALADSGPTRSATAPRQGDPLQRLRERSAERRWRAERDRVFSKRSPRQPNRPGSSDSGGDGGALRPIPDEPAREPLSDVSSRQPPQSLGQQYGDLYSETPISDILPFYDYEPERIRTAEPDCIMICPCPEGTNCRKPGGTKPCLCPEDYVTRPWERPAYQERQFAKALFSWEASNIAYNPLYFEDPALERYGHTYHDLIQPFASVGRFAGQLALLPYQMSINHIRRPIYPLGHYRPGEWAPRLHYQIPLNAKAAAVEAGVVSGLFLIFP